MSAEQRLAEAITLAFRRRERAEAHALGLVRAMVADRSVLWFSRDAELQRDFERGFDEGMALKRGQTVDEEPTVQDGCRIH